MFPEAIYVFIHVTVELQDRSALRDKLIALIPLEIAT
jgi:hypothetical protein